jgi:PAS domain S-box-containing protein
MERMNDMRELPGDRIVESLRQALKKAEEEKNRSDAVIAAIGDGISIQDTEYRVLFQNEAHRKLIGDHVGEYCYKAYEHKDNACEGCPVALSFKDGGIHTMERSAPTERGTVYVEITSSVLRDPSGTIIAGIEIARDITARKRSGIDLLERTRHALLGADVGVALTRGDAVRPMLQSCAEAQVRHLDAFLARIWTLNEEENTLELQASAGAYTHLDGPHSRIQLDHYDHTIGHIAKNRKPHLTNAVIGDPLISDQEWARRERIVAFAGHPLMVEDRLVGVMGMFFRNELSGAALQALSSIANEIALGIEHKRAETERENITRELQKLIDKVKNSQQEWQDTFDNIQDPIYITDADYTIKRANQAFIEFVGKPFSAVLDRKCFDLLQESGEPYQHCPHEALRETGMPMDVEITDPVRKRTLVVSHFPYSLMDGTFGGAVSIIRDVTEEREKEMRLIMAERLGSLGQMAASIAHEINNPLASILGCAEALHLRVKKGRFDAALFEKYLSIVQEEVARCKNITTNMLSVSRSANYEKDTIDINITLQRTIELMGYQGRLKDLQVNKEFAPGLPPLQGNEGDLRQVFIAVITNALDAMNNSGVLTIGTLQEGNTLSITIRDTGPGIPPEQVGRVFDPFFTTKSGQGGTGLGLAIARKIVANYKGDISLSSKQGEGTSVVITLPLPETAV